MHTHAAGIAGARDRLVTKESRMVRRWLVPLAALALSSGSLLAGASSASAAPVSHHSSHPVSAAGYRPGGLLVRPSSGSSLATHAGHTTAYSTNWSGYAATGRNGAFTSVSASWTEPTVSCPGGFQYSSFWAGLDGYSSGSVEQTGTDADCSGTTPVYYGWYEMYPAYPVNFSNTVRPGDKMSASVTFSGSSTYTLVLKDNTRGWTKSVVKSQTGLARSSAEVITEAPSSTRGVLPLADFHTVYYSTSAANGTSLASHNPVKIIMVDNSGRYKDTTSSISSVGAFSNTWLRSK
jgi:Peptidase A4 family